MELDFFLIIYCYYNLSPHSFYFVPLKHSVTVKILQYSFQPESISSSF